MYSEAGREVTVQCVIGSRRPALLCQAGYVEPQQGKTRIRLLLLPNRGGVLGVVLCLLCNCITWGTKLQTDQLTAARVGQL